MRSNLICFSSLLPFLEMKNWDKAHLDCEKIESSLGVPGIKKCYENDLCKSSKMSPHQGSAILSESIRNRDSKRPGIGIGIESCPSLGLGVSIGIESLGFSIVSESIFIQPGLVYQITWFFMPWHASPSKGQVHCYKIHPLTMKVQQTSFFTVVPSRTITTLPI